MARSPNAMCPWRSQASAKGKFKFLIYTNRYAFVEFETPEEAQKAMDSM